MHFFPMRVEIKQGRYLTKGMGPHRDPITSGTPAGARYRVTVRPWRWETLALDPGWRPWAQRS